MKIPNAKYMAIGASFSTSTLPTKTEKAMPKRSIKKRPNNAPADAGLLGLIFNFVIFRPFNTLL
jgi:hypothetical protein